MQPERNRRYRIWQLDRQPLTFHAADLDGDGRPDLVLAEFIAGTESGVALFFNRGSWVFERGHRLATGDFTVGIEPGDADGDGDLDLLALNRNSSDVRVFWNDGGTFAWLFLSGEPPAAPGPERCGEDPTADLLGFCLEAGC